MIYDHKNASKDKRSIGQMKSYKIGEHSKSNKSIDPNYNMYNITPKMHKEYENFGNKKASTRRINIINDDPMSELKSDDEEDEKDNYTD